MISFVHLVAYNLDRDGGANLPELQSATIDQHVHTNFQLHPNALVESRIKSIHAEENEQKTIVYIAEKRFRFAIKFAVNHYIPLLKCVLHPQHPNHVMAIFHDTVHPDPNCSQSSFSC